VLAVCVAEVLGIDILDVKVVTGRHVARGPVDLGSLQLIHRRPAADGAANRPIRSPCALRSAEC